MPARPTPRAPASRPGEPGGQTRGVAVSLVASALFGLIFYVAGTVDASPETVFAWRVLLTAACYTAPLAHPAGRRALRRFTSVLRSTRTKPLVLLLLTLLVGVQLWLFTWTPAHGHALDASLGYLLLPIALVLVGRFVFHSPVTPLQWVAVLIAAVGVTLQVTLTPSVSWVTFAICLGYAAYFTLRRHAGLDMPAAFGAEVALMTPVAGALLATGTGPATPGGYAAVLVAGLAGAAAMSAYLAASRLLTLPLFGLLSYVEPVLLVIVGLLLGETLDAVDAVVYATLALALVLLAVDGFRASWHSRARARRGDPPRPPR